jgi:hypothetical protein
MTKSSSNAICLFLIPVGNFHFAGPWQPTKPLRLGSCAANEVSFS